MREHYLRVRDEVRIHDRELAAYVDLNVAVSYVDSFQFAEAGAFVESAISDPLFEALSPVMKGMCYSALGQYHAMLGEGERAEACFVQALAQFDIADLKSEEREGERWQTGIYRAINAMDARLPQVRELVHAIVPLEEDSIADLAGDGSHGNEYRHHLLLRALYFLPELKDLRDCYLNARDTWVCGQQHPWELICLYRGLLLLSSEVPDARNLAARKFDEGFRICCDESHGATLNLIGAMITTAAFCVTGLNKYHEQATGVLRHMPQRLPEASSAVVALRGFLAAPQERAIQHALAALPFNYH